MLLLNSCEGLVLDKLRSRPMILECALTVSSGSIGW
jgi:hypothetical protein